MRLCAYSFLLSFVMLLVTSMPACKTSSSSKTTTMETKSMQQKRPLQFLALGDSYTIGESVLPADRWPVQLVELLRSEGLVIDDPAIIATTGWTTDELSAAIDKENPTGVYDLVSLLIGVNNQYRGRSAEEYRREFGTLLQRAIAFAGGVSSKVIVLSIPDWGVTPFAEGRDREKIAREIDQFNGINFEEAVRAGAQYVDVTPVSREAIRYPELLAEDKLHPSGVMYAEWARLALSRALKVLKTP
jgi:lysophospholipase L1-like esterase